MKTENPPPAAAPDLTGNRLLARNAIINLAGQGAPMVVALFAIPLLIDGLGTARFGVLTLVWVVIGYFGLLDLGLSRALTQLVAERLGAGREREVPALVWTALALASGMGLLGTGATLLLAPWFSRTVLDLSGALLPEAVPALYLLAFSLPAVAGTGVLRGVLEAQQRFGLVNAVRTPMAVFTYASPLLVLPFSSSLVPVIGALLAGRVVSWAIHLWLCLRTLPALRERFELRREVLAPLVRFGSWTTVSNVVSPLMAYLDRFLIGAMLSVTAVAFYVTPQEVVTKLLLVPIALVGVLFPAFATSFGQDRARTALLFDRGVRAILLALFPVVLVLVTLAPEGLALWLGGEFPARSARVLQWLAAGVFLNGLAQAPFAALQGVGRPDVTGRLHLLELPLYLAALWALVGRFGIEGAAMAWAFRVMVDTAVLFLLADRFLESRGAVLRRIAPWVAAVVVLLAAAALLEGLAVKFGFLAAALSLYALLGWYRVLTADERLALRGWLRSPPPPLSRLGEGAGR